MTKQGWKNTMILFICETNAQLLNALNIRVNMYTDEQADVLLCCTNDKIRKLIDIVSNSNVFDNVYSFEIKNYADQTFKSMAKKLIRNISYVNLVGNLLPNANKIYDEIFVSGPGIKCISVYYFFKKKYEKTKLNLYEEGIFEYYIFSSKKNRLRRPYSRLFYGRYYLDDCSSLFVYQPNLVSSHPDSVRVCSIPPINSNKNFKIILNEIFEYKKCDDIDIIKNCKCLYIEQQFPTKIENNRQKSIISNIAKRYNVGEFVVKLHPLSDKRKYDDISIRCIKSSQTMEMLYLNGLKSEIKLYSICSTAVFSPYLMFNYKPEIVLLYKLFKSITVEDEMIRTIERFVSTYPDGNAKIIESMGEIKDD